jgi:hypothetical protein
VARGDGFLEPLGLAGGRGAHATAQHPPLYPLFLAALDALGVHGELAHRLWSVVPSVATMTLTGVVARDLAGERAGLLAAGASAASVALAVHDVLLWSEGFYVATLLFVVWSTYRFCAAPGVGGAAVLALAVGVCALTRAEGALLFVLLAPLVWRAAPTARDALGWLGVGVLVVAVLVAPWFAYNLSRFEHPVVLSTGLGGILGSSNCDVTYSGPQIGGWGFVCADLPRRLPQEESEVDLLMRRAGVDYVVEHADRLPAVVPVRVLRTFGFWRPVKLATADLAAGEAGVGWLGWVAMLQYWAYLGLGAVGVVALRRRHRRVWPVLAPAALSLVVTVLAYGTFRFRVGLDAVLPVLVGVALATRAGRHAAAAPDSLEALTRR